MTLPVVMFACLLTSLVHVDNNMYKCMQMIAHSEKKHITQCIFLYN